MQTFKEAARIELDILEASIGEMEDRGITHKSILRLCAVLEGEAAELRTMALTMKEEANDADTVTTPSDCHCGGADCACQPHQTDID